MHEHEFVFIEDWSHTSLSISLKFALHQSEDLFPSILFGMGKIQPSDAPRSE
jgi:hypothetical protein